MSYLVYAYISLNYHSNVALKSLRLRHRTVFSMGSGT